MTPQPNDGRTEQDAATATRWHVVCDWELDDNREEDIKPEASDRVWTVSLDPKDAGWITDGGCYGYGLRKDYAKELATAANSHAALLKVLEAAENYLAESSGPAEFMRPLDAAISEARRLLDPKGGA